jgi:uncharacterized membrane protein
MVSMLHARHDRFRWRSHEISRIEGLSDAVFAFAVTLLIISLEVPRTFGELQQAMRGFLPFALSFAMLLFIWYSQYLWFRRYALQDSLAVLLNGALLFIVLFYVYPLKFLSTLMMSQLMGSGNLVHLPDGRVEPIIRAGEVTSVMLIYDGGFIAVFLVLALLYWYAWSKRAQLELDAIEQHKTIEKMGAHLCLFGVGVVSLLIVLIGGERAVAIAGMFYFSIGPVLTVYYTLMGRRSRAVGAAG